MKVCQNCGHKNTDTNNFCESCAAPMNTASIPPTEPQTFEFEYGVASGKCGITTLRKFQH